MFRSTKPFKAAFDLWVKDSEAYRLLDDAAKLIVKQAFAHGWNSAVKSYLPTNSQAEAAFSLGQEVNEVIADFENEPDRSVAIVGAAYVDDVLRTAIAAAFVDDKDARKRFAKQSYSARCDLAFCLGYFRKESLADFEAIGEVRNQFAHRRGVKSFGDPGIRERCQNLRTVKAIDGRTYTDPRECFIAAVAVISVALSHRARRAPQRLSWGNVWETAF
jgi:hypothetical protein